MIEKAIYREIRFFFEEDDLSRNMFYLNSLPQDEVECHLFIKDDLILAGLPYFLGAFKYLGSKISNEEELLEHYEGKHFSKSENKVISFKLPFNVALTGERIALNLLQRASGIATYTAKFVEKAEKYNIAILDTRKTTPGLRSLEKYAVRVGGGHNHRMGQADVWMIKDNHKKFFGGLKGAWDYFKSMQTFYNPTVVEIHDLKELDEARELGVKHVMLDNFSTEMLNQAISKKADHMTYEISGGIRLDNIENYLKEGVDAISIGALTYAAPAVDLSLKYE